MHKTGEEGQGETPGKSVKVIENVAKQKENAGNTTRHLFNYQHDPVKLPPSPHLPGQDEGSWDGHKGNGRSHKLKKGPSRRGSETGVNYSVGSGLPGADLVSQAGVQGNVAGVVEEVSLPHRGLPVVAAYRSGRRGR